MSHGYFYDQRKQQPSWLSDTQLFDLTTQEWTTLHASINDPSQGPTARYGSAAAYHNGFLYLHGGDDGGSSLGGSSFHHQLLRDTWRLDLETNKWEKVDDSTGPALAQHSSAVLNDRWFLAGGLVQHSGEVKGEGEGGSRIEDNPAVWVMDLRTRTKTWSNLNSMNGRTSYPKPRFGASLTSLDGQLYLFGGFARDADISSSTVDPAIWRLAVSKRRSDSQHEDEDEDEIHSWSLCTLETKDHPSPRGFHSAVGHAGEIVVFGGGRCDPGCVLNNEVWSFRPAASAHAGCSGRWVEYSNSNSNSEGFGRAATSNPSHPRARYRHTAVVWPPPAAHAAATNAHADASSSSSLSSSTAVGSAHRMFLFGGESYMPGAYWNDLWQLQLPVPASTPAAADRTPSSPWTWIGGLSVVIVCVLVALSAAKGIRPCSRLTSCVKQSCCKRKTKTGSVVD